MFSTTRRNGKPPVEKHEDSTSDFLKEHAPARRAPKTSVDLETQNLNAKLANPLAGIPREDLIVQATLFAEKYGLQDLTPELQKGALVAQDPTAFEEHELLDEKDKAILRRELTHRWSHPKTLYYLVILCSMAACVQGMDEAVINGANIFFATQLGINPEEGDRNQWLFGLVNSAPYLCCAIVSPWLVAPLNHYLGRRGTIFVTAIISWLTCIWQGLTNTWWHLFIARFVLGVGIGPKSATVPIYAAESAPPVIRGALVMMWQTWTAFGIMLGTVIDLAFFKIPDLSGIRGLNWRLMLGSAGVPAFWLAILVYFCPESPRWYMRKGRYRDAFNSLARLRHTKLQAARDIYYIHVLLEAEKDSNVQGRNRFFEMFTIPRNRRATVASFIVMFMQQFCGINVIAYYSTNIFVQAKFTEKQALIASWGYGMINWLFAIPAIYTIDTFGRRNLLLISFPLMATFLLLTGFAFWIPFDPDNPDGKRIAVVALGIYLFAMAYSPGEGPVPFTYSAEAFPLYIREVGMSCATAILWFFNFILALTWPRLLGAFGAQGAFGWYAAWNVVGFIAALLFVPETKALSLEELDQVFSVPTRIHAAYQLKALPHNIRKYIFRMKVDDLPPLYKHEGVIGTKTYAPGGAGHA
ncbi:hypothetical protein E1B28_009418 [Marasmius oreades]|uniref:Major facilitator superfamily (MFS) profile domain-containing protein n=1 Tax=Marasmius oreades TaxID=181124 RepID=A0A9P7S0N3_9AGAR|nr:uncharacterized protein E1B28_009418 [Marasmius oreades]KAG7093135.1 hypothetical protein E1B28_009418 [Marasmius oreades]